MGVSPFMALVAVRLISLIGTRTSACAPRTYTLREAEKGVVVKPDPTDVSVSPVATPLPIVLLLMEEILSPKRELCSVIEHKKTAPDVEGGAAERPTVSCCSRFPTLVLPRSGSEGRPFGRTLSRMAPLASMENRIASLLHCQRGIRPILAQLVGLSKDWDSFAIPDSLIVGNP